jgi:pantoate--beta-alanine ligase
MAWPVLISQTLFKVRDMWGTKPIADLRRFVEGEFEKDGYMKLIYFEIANTKTLQPVDDNAKQAIACIAVFDGKIRLIDNVLLG